MASSQRDALDQGRWLRLVRSVGEAGGGPRVPAYSRKAALDDLPELGPMSVSQLEGAPNFLMGSLCVIVRRRLPSTTGW